MCPMCKNQSETVQHCLFECTVARETWNLMCQHVNRNATIHNIYNNIVLPPHPIPNTICQQAQRIAPIQYQRRDTPSAIARQPPPNFEDFLKMQEHKEDFTLCCYIIWNIWLARNGKVYQNQVQTPQQTFHISLLLSQEYWWATKHNLFTPEANGQQLERTKPIKWIKWEAPTNQWLKINTDGATKMDGIGTPEVAGAGWICRDDRGSVIMAMATPIGKTSAIIAETWAMLLATRMEITKEWQYVHFETDSTSLLALISKEQSEAPWIIQNMLHEIRQNLQ
ncbi:uncharacterized protein LOC113335447 [Papaver somniferum]|uniref:uncharacterized protein LOC113335447 n=1 Tax=Papaver somniferum TaxID=3469 RepID=UPI000E6FAF8A|nr:uncharacterized protein LOC113335447 [Papaver somniferum]